jgi:hypothetical protein
MAAEVTSPLPVRAESRTLLTFEGRLRAYLDERLQVRTRFASLGATRALLVSPADRERAKALVIDERATAAERVYIYVHVAAHIALGHNIPLVTIVESDEAEPQDEMKHELAERLARSMWWRGADAEVAALLPAVRTSRVLRSLLSWPASRALTRWALLGLRAVAYRSGIVRALERNAATAWLGQALCVAAVVSAAPQLASGGKGGSR